MRLYMCKKITIVTFICVLTIMSAYQNTYAAKSFDPTTQRCEEEFQSMSKGVEFSREQAAVLIAKWKNYSGMCKGTGMYEFRMGALYMLAGDYGKAKQILETALSNKVKNSNYVRTELLNIKFRELLYSGNRDRSKYEAIIKELSEMAKNDNTTSYIYEQLASDQLILHDWKGAINSATNALFINNDSWLAMSTLVVAYSETGQYHLAQRFIDKVVPMHPELKANAAFDFAAAKTYIALGAPKIASSILKTLAHYHPQVKDDEGFKAIEAEVKNALSQTKHGQ